MLEKQLQMPPLVKVVVSMVQKAVLTVVKMIKNSVGVKMAGF